VRFEHLYVHVPFCARRCVYCDFSIAVRRNVPAREFVDAVSSELRIRHPSSQLDLKTLYVGGGTPSKLGGTGVRALLEALASRAHVGNGAEVTLEANPEDVTVESASSWRAAGVTRVSLGVQSFDDGVLAWMHRTHDANAAQRAIQVLREVGRCNLSIDLIFALPEHLRRDWRADLEKAISYDLPHVSLYGLSVEAHTPLGRWVAGGKNHEAPEESFESQFLAADSLMRSCGYEHYEVSNYGKPGYHSRHNWAYWARKPYVGLGPSAHEFDGSRRRWNVSAFEAWRAAVSQDLDPLQGSEFLSDEQIEQESLYLGLRTSMGVPVPSRSDPRLSRWIAAGWGSLTGDSRLRLAGAGWLRLDTIASDLTTFGSRY
jgi:oxygen-independent coproporphyrinogen III oxidase